MNKHWYEIIDFPDYKISEDCICVNIITNRILKATKDAKCDSDQFSLVANNRKRYWISEKRLLYCAYKGISPLTLHRNQSYLFYWNKKGVKSIENILIKEPFEQAMEMRVKARDYYVKDNFYQTQLEFSKCVLENNFDRINDIIDRDKIRIVGVLAKACSSAEKDLEITYTQLKSIFIQGVAEGRYYPAHPTNYIIKMIKNIYRNNKRHKLI